MNAIFPIACALLCAADVDATTGKMLVLENERTLEGDVEKVGEIYRLRRGSSETTIPASQVLKLCADVNEAFEYVRSRANLRDADERLRLARWCHLHGLRERGLIEAKAALELRPKSGEAARLVRMLERPVVEPASVEASAEDEEPPAPPDLTMETLSQYVCKVQPILMNTCANCHAGDRGGEFKLVRSFELAKPQSRSTQRNLTAVLKYVDGDDPARSPLLHKALSVHGGLSQAPLKGRQSAAYRSLEDWVHKASAEKPRATTATAREPANLSAVVIQASAPMPGTPPGGPPSAPLATTGNPTTILVPVSALAPDSTGKTHAASKGEWASDRPKASDEPAKRAAPRPVDPFDPMEFNRQMHPGREAEGKSPTPPSPPGSGPGR